MARMEGGDLQSPVASASGSQSGLAGAVGEPVEGTSPSHETAYRPLRPASLESAGSTPSQVFQAQRHTHCRDPRRTLRLFASVSRHRPARDEAWCWGMPGGGLPSLRPVSSCLGRCLWRRAHRCVAFARPGGSPARRPRRPDPREALAPARLRRRPGCAMVIEALAHRLPSRPVMVPVDPSNRRPSDEARAPTPAAGHDHGRL
jgi:hypothetical protein